MKPLVYGYLRVLPDEPDDVVRRIEQALQDYADVEGYYIAALFHDFGSTDDRAFYELVEELRRAEARHVVVPSLDHFSRHPILRDGMVMHLQLAAGADLHEATSHAPTPG